MRSASTVAADSKLGSGNDRVDHPDLVGPLRRHALTSEWMMEAEHGELVHPFRPTPRRPSYRRS
jgi:hypothetical protein